MGKTSKGVPGGLATLDADGNLEAAQRGALTGTATLDFPSIAAAGNEELSITVTGAQIGDAVALAPPALMTDGLVWSGRVESEDTVMVRLANITASPVDPASAVWGAAVFPM